jgi:hypothetical protein
VQLGHRCNLTGLQLREGRSFSLAVDRQGRFRLAVVGDGHVQKGLLLREASEALGDFSLLDLTALHAFFQVHQAVLGTFALRLDARSLSVSLMRRRGGALRAFLDGMRLHARGLECDIFAFQRLGSIGGAREKLVQRRCGDPARDDHLEQPVRGVMQEQVLELAAVLDEAVRLRGLALQAGPGAIYFRDDIRDARQVLARLIHLSLRLLAALLVLGDPRGFFDVQAAIFWSRADDLADPALLDN